MNRIKTYYRLTKPGIIYGNLFTSVAGFLLASKGTFNFSLCIATMLGIGLVIGSACAFNNYLDRNIDQKMARTKNRALAAGTIPVKNALIFATILGLLGFAVLTVYTNLLTVGIGLVGYVDYLIFYGISKRQSVHGTLIGSISGSMPIVAGYTAVTNHFDLGALLLFLILTFWQMPHFYAIAMYRLTDYAKAGLPVLPVKRGMLETKIQTLAYLVAFIVAAVLLTVFKYTGYAYLTVMGILGVVWFAYGVLGFTTKNDTKWAKKMFLFSLIALVLLSIMISVNGIRPVV